MVVVLHTSGSRLQLQRNVPHYAEAVFISRDQRQKILSVGLGGNLPSIHGHPSMANATPVSLKSLRPGQRPTISFSFSSRLYAKSAKSEVLISSVTLTGTSVPAPPLLKIPDSTGSAEPIFPARDHV